MSDPIQGGAVHEWRQLCQNAFFELDPIKLLERIVEARSAVLDRIEDALAKPIIGEQCALRNALETLSILQELAERDIGKLDKTVQTQYLANYARYNKRESSA